MGQSRGYIHVSAGGVPYGGVVPSLTVMLLGQASQRKPRGNPEMEVGFQK